MDGSGTDARMRTHILVTGASGAIGGTVVRALARTGREVIGLVRRRSYAGPAGVAHRVADYHDPAALARAFRDVDTLVFVSADGDAARVLLAHRNVVDTAREAGIDHVVYLSGLDADPASPFTYAVTNGVTEQLLAASGMGFSIARASIFAEFFAQWPRAAVDTGELRVPAADGRVSLVARTDAAHALAALACRAPSDRHHDITGPEALDMATIAVRYGRVAGRPLEYVDVTPRQHRQWMADDGTDAWWAYAYDTMFASIREHRWETVSDAVAQLTGRPPLPFEATL